MASRIRDDLGLILAAYTDARKTEAFGSSSELWDTFNDLKETLSNSPPLRRRPTLWVIWSAGKGNWAKVPWIAFLDERETQTTQRGVYCVFLFRQDMSGVYLTFNQGVAEPNDKFGKPKAHEILRDKAANLRRLCDGLGGHAFRLDNEIDMRADWGLGLDYESSTIAYKLYEPDLIPEDEIVLNDLEAVLGAYDRYLATDKWRDALDFCSIFLEDRERFEKQEIEYKLRIIDAIRRALDPTGSAKDFRQGLRRAFTNADNNLTSWQAHDRFTKWAGRNPEQAREAVRALVAEEESVVERVNEFLERVPNEAVSGLGTRISIASYLLMGTDPENYPFYKPTPFEKVERTLGWPRALEDESPGEVYAHHRRFTEGFLKKLQQDGLDARDILDAQSLIWMLASDKRPAFAVWRGETNELAEILDTVTSWLDNLNTQISPDGRFHYKPLLLLAALDVLDADTKHGNQLGYDELLDAFMKLVDERDSTAAELQFSQPYLNMRNDVVPEQIWCVATSAGSQENIDSIRGDYPGRVRSVAPWVYINPLIWSAFKFQEGRNRIRQEILKRWPSGNDMKPQVFVFTAGNPEAQQHLADSIERPIADELVFANSPRGLHKELERVREIGNGFYAWGAVPGIRNIPTWGQMKRGDYVLCVYDNAYHYVARVAAKYDNRELARKIWGQNAEGAAWQYMYFLTEPIKIYRPITELADLMHSRYLGFTRISDDRLEGISSEYGSVKKFIEFVVGQSAVSLMTETLEQGVTIDRARLLRQVNPDFAPVPEFVTDFVVSYLEGNSPSSLLDAWASAGGWLPSLADALNPEVVVGLLRNSTEREVVRQLGQDRAVDWRLGEPLLLLDQIAGPFDAVVGSPLWNMRPVERLTLNTDDGQIEVRDYSSNLLILKAATLLAPNGVGCFIVPSSFMRKHASSASASLEPLGLHIDAILEIPRGVLKPRETQSGHLLIVRRGQPDRLFVGELTPDAKSRSTLLENLKARKRGKVPQLGLLVDSTTPSLSPQALFMEHELKERASTFGFTPVALLDLAMDIKFVTHSDGAELKDAPNIVYLPLMGRSSAVTAVADLTLKPHHYVQIILDPDKAVAEYVANFFNTTLGQRIRESLFIGSTVPRITRSQLDRAVVYLPDLETQEELLATHAAITNLKVELENYQRQLWNQPRKAADIAKAIKNLTREDTLEAWIATLPFPLASILWAYRADRNPQNKRDHLFNFFEALSEFTATLMLSAFCSDKAFYAEESENWIEKDPMYRKWFLRSTLGGWNRLSERLAKRTRTLLSVRETREKCLSLFGQPDAGFLEMIANKRLFSVLREVEERRNRWKGHSGILDPREIQGQVRLLQENLSAVQGIVADWYGTALIVSPGSLEFSAGTYRHNVRMIRGPITPFVEEVVETLSPMDKQKLYLLHQNQYQPIELLLFFRLMESPKTQQNACYFYNRLGEGEDVRWVSYHFNREAELFRPDSELRSALSLLEPHNSEIE